MRLARTSLFPSLPSLHVHILHARDMNTRIFEIPTKKTRSFKQRNTKFDFSRYMRVSLENFFIFRFYQKRMKPYRFSLLFFVLGLFSISRSASSSSLSRDSLGIPPEGTKFFSFSFLICFFKDVLIDSASSFFCWLLRFEVLQVRLY